MSELVTSHCPLRTDKIPNGWALVAVGDIAEDIQTGFSSGEHNSDGVGVPHLRPMNISPDGAIDLTDGRFVSCENPLRLRRGDVLFNNTNSPAWVGKTALIETDADMAFSNHMTRLRVHSGIEPVLVAKQLHFLCSSGYFLHQCTKHVNQASISRTFLAESTPLLLPPLAEQRRIAAKIDSLQFRSRKAREALSDVRPMLDQFRQSLLAAAFRGDLTADWRAAHPDIEPATELITRIRQERSQRREEAELAKYKAKDKQPPKSWQDRSRDSEAIDLSELPELPSTWCWVSMEELVEVQLGQRRAPEFARLKKYPYLRAANITWKGLDLSDVKSMGFRAPEPLFLQKGDVILNEASGSKGEVGKPAIWGDELESCCFQATVLRLRSRFPFFRPEWLFYNRLLGALRAEYAAKTPGIGIIHLTAKLMRKWPVPLAPVAEQDQVTQMVAIAIGQINDLDTSLSEAEAELAQLNQSILDKAFRGELVPQDPVDESAAILLKRIQQARAQQRKKRSNSKSTKKRAAMRLNVDEELKEWVSKTDEKPFTFDDLRRDISTDYDELRDAVYAMLDEKTEVEQVFDESIGAICFRRLLK